MDANNKKRKLWISLISEFIIVIMGILIALQINNWNEDRKDRKLEKILLNEFLVNLKGDLEDIEEDIELLDNVFNSGEIILKSFKEGKPCNDSLKIYFGELSLGAIFANNISPYESLKSVGIDIIRNENIRENITLLYSTRYRFMSKLEDFQHNIMTNLLFPILSKNLIMDFDSKNFSVSAIPLYPDEIAHNNAFKESIKLNNIYIHLQILHYKSLKKLIIQLKEDIETELGYNNKEESSE